MGDTDTEVKVTLGVHDQRLSAVERDIKQIRESVCSVDKSIQDLRLDMAKRPSWFTAGVFSVLCGLIATLATYIVTKLAAG